jgi:hypothetical protein
VAPQPALGGRIDAVDELGQPIDEPGIAGGRRIEHADGDLAVLVVRSHTSRMPARIERGNT